MAEVSMTGAGHEHAVYARNPDVSWRVVAGEGVIIDARTSRVLGVNETAAVLWEALDGKTPLREVVQASVLEEFEGIDEAAALADAAAWLDDLVAKGFATRSG